MATSKRLVHTRKKDGGITVSFASKTALRYMTNGGGRWNGFPADFIEKQIARHSSDEGVEEDAAKKFVHAMQFGGLTTAEAYQVLSDRWLKPVGLCIELWDAEEVPQDRWFRNAWKRSANGGPITIDLVKARLIQWQNISFAVREEMIRREQSLDSEPKLEFQSIEFRKYIRQARDEDELRKIWPEGVPCLSPSLPPSRARSSIASVAAG